MTVVLTVNLFDLISIMYLIIYSSLVEHSFRYFYDWESHLFSFCWFPFRVRANTRFHRPFSQIYHTLQSWSWGHYSSLLWQMLHLCLPRLASNVYYYSSHALDWKSQLFLRSHHYFCHFLRISAWSLIILLTLDNLQYEWLKKIQTRVLNPN